MAENGYLETVIVLSGGLSHERDVSLRSGRRVSQALRSRVLRSWSPMLTPACCLGSLS